jgi:galactose mutarotase-like enzyme
MITIENDYLKVEVNELGAELHSVFDKQANRELLFQKDAKVWPHQDVVLFPFIGPAEKYLLDGKEYSCASKHGFCRVEEFRSIARGDDYVSLRLLPDALTKACYPFDFVFTATYKVERNSLRRSYLIEEKDGKTLPCCVGDHAAYQAAFGSAVLHLGAGPLSYLPRPNGILQEPTAFPHEGDYLLRKDDFAEYETIVLLNPRHPISLTTGFGEVLTYHFHSPYIAVWSPSVPCDFVCVEPWWGLPTYQGQPAEVRCRKDYNLISSHALFEEKISFQRQ